MGLESNGVYALDSVVGLRQKIHRKAGWLISLWRVPMPRHGVGSRWKTIAGSLNLGLWFLLGREGTLGAVGYILATVPCQIPAPHFFLSQQVLLSFYIREQLKQRGNSAGSRQMISDLSYIYICAWAMFFPEKNPHELEGMITTSDLEACSTLQPGWIKQIRYW